MARAWDVLYALLAFHLKDLSRDGLLEGLQGVSEDASDSLPSRLVKAGILSSEEAELIRRLAEAATQAHDGNAEAAVMSLGGEESLWKSLDPDRTLSTPSGRTTTPMRITPFEVSQMYTIDPIEEIPGRYATTSEYGRGGMGRILLAHDLKMGRDIALKELLPTNETSMILPEKSPVRYTAAIAARFLQEGRVTAGLEHPSIVPVYEIGRRPNGNLYYTMKLVRGQSLARALRECKSLEERLSFLPHFVDLCEAVAYAHSRGVLHRDLKPSNVMIGEFGETVVLDWGLAKIKAHREDPLEKEIRDIPRRLVNDETPLPETREGQAMGTPEYMSPEQAQGVVEQIDERSDLYSLGVVLYELLAGTTPFRAESASETMRRVVQNDAPPIRDKEPDAPAELVSICEKALQKKPSQRYESVRTLADEVKRFQTGALVQTYRYSLGELARRYYKRHRGVLNVIGAAAAIVLCLAVISYIQIYQARNRADAQRKIAEDARDIAIVAEEKAQKAREEADHTAYLAQIRLLEAYVRNRNFARANTLVWSISEARRNWEWGYLLEQCNQDLFTLRGHESLLFRTVFDHAGNRVLTLAGDRTARVWNASDGTPLAVIRTPEGLINDGQISPDDAAIVLALWNGTARLYDAATGEEKVVFKGHAGSVGSVRFAFGGTRLVTGSNDGTARVWDTGSGQQTGIFEGHESEVVGAYPSPDDTTLVSATHKGQLRLWNIEESQTPLLAVPGMYPEYSASGARFCYVDNGAAVVCDVAGQSEVLRTQQGSARVLRARFSPDGKLLLAAATDGVGRLYDVETGRLVNSFNHGEEAKDGRFSPDQRLILLVSDAGLVTVWDIAEGALVTSFAGHEAGIATAVFSRDSTRVATASRDNTARIWDTRRTLIRRDIATHPAPINRIAVSGNGNHIAVASRDRAVTVYEGPRLIPRVSHWCFSHFGPATAALNADGTILAAPLDEFAVFALDTATGETITCRAHRGRVTAVAFAPNGGTIVTGGGDHMAYVWEPRGDREPTVLRGHTDRLGCAAFSPDGALIATGADDSTVRVWNANDGSVRHVLTKHERRVNDVAFSPDGSQLLSASDDGSVLCWDVERGEGLYELAGHADHVASARFSPDGARILTASWDETVRVWEAGTGEELVALPGGEHPFLNAEFLGNSQSILVAGWDGHLTAHFAGPWRMEQLDGVAGSTLRERFEAAKATRLANRWPEHDALEGATVMVHTTEERVRTHLGRLLTLLDQTAPYESESPGLAIAEGSMANAVRRLCLLPGDVVTRMNETPVQGYDSARTAIAEYLESGPEPELQLEIVREGEPLRVGFAFHPVILAQNSVTLPREQAQKAVEYLAGALLVGIEQLLRVNQDMNTRIGEPVASRETLNGLWVPSAGGPEGALLYETLGIATGDRVVRVNQSAIEELGQVRDFIHTARTALKDDTPVKLEVEAERGEFQTISLTVEVK